jgi:L-asparaginase
MTKNAADKNGGVVPTLTASSRVDAVPGLGTIAHIRARAFHRLPSAQLGYDDLDALTAAVCDLSKASYRGVVVPRCTDTIEEAASVLDRLSASTCLSWSRARCATRPKWVPMKLPVLLTAVQVVLSDEARGKGCLHPRWQHAPADQPPRHAD